MKNHYQFATQAIHAGEAPCPVTGALDTPIYQSTTFVSPTSDEMAALSRYFREQGLYTLVRWNTFYTNPPLCINEQQLREAFAIIVPPTHRCTHGPAPRSDCRRNGHYSVVHIHGRHER